MKKRSSRTTQHLGMLQHIGISRGIDTGLLETRPHAPGTDENALNGECYVYPRKLVGRR